MTHDLLPILQQHVENINRLQLETIYLDTRAEMSAREDAVLSGDFRSFCHRRSKLR